VLASTIQADLRENRSILKTAISSHQKRITSLQEAGLRSAYKLSRQSLSSSEISMICPFGATSGLARLHDVVTRANKKLPPSRVRILMLSKYARDRA
jgi:hypothetical protein